MTLTRNSSLWIGSLVAVIGSAALSAQEAGGSSSLLDKILGLQDGFSFGTIIQILIILASIFMLGWAIECFINVKREKIAPPEMVAHLQGYLDEGDLEGALQYCEAAPNTLTRAIAAPLGRLQSGWGAMTHAFAQQVSVEGGKLNSHIGPLSLVAAIGPMMGLFGTVTGMVMAFDTMAQKGANMSASDVAGSIGLALMSTVMGLIVAIPGMIFFWVFSNRVAGIMDDITLVGEDMLESMRPYVQQQG